MHLSLPTLIAAVTLVVGSPLPRAVPEGVLALSLDRQDPSTLAPSRRSPNYNAELENTRVRYLATLQIGTPAQTVRAVLDTGSYDLWTYANSYKLGNFDQAHSSTYKVSRKGGFGDQYNTENWTKGDWATDVVGIDGALLDNQAFGVVTSGNIGEPWGILGVGIVPDSSYLNLPAQLVTQGKIQRNIYSLYLNDYNTASGTILFGGLDTAKYDGKLLRVPFHGDSWHGPSAIDLDLTVLGTTAAALFDSGAPFSRLPTSAWNKLVAQMKEQIPSLQTDSDGHLYTNNAAAIPANQYLPISISGHEFKVPYSELFGDGYVSNDSYYLLAEDAESEDTRILAGDAILRSLYLVYDLDGHAVYLAQAKYTSESNVQAIPAGGVPADLVL